MAVGGLGGLHWGGRRDLAAGGGGGGAVDGIELGNRGGREQCEWLQNRGGVVFPVAVETFGLRKILGLFGGKQLDQERLGKRWSWLQ